MIPRGRLRESGFPDEARFPKELVDHEIELSLPSAMQFGVSPVRVRVARGLVVPLQAPGSANGTVIRGDGAILHIGHREANNPASELEARFISDVPYALRVEISHIMRRALQADPSLQGVWDQVMRAWMIWFSAEESVKAFKQAGVFAVAGLAWKGIENLTGQLITELQNHAPVPPHVKVRVVVQHEAEFIKGWRGEEFLVDEVAASAIIRAGWINYVKNYLFSKMRLVLGNPVFHPRSTFKLFYGAASSPTIKLVVVPLPEAGEGNVSAAGIELDGTCRDSVLP